MEKTKVLMSRDNPEGYKLEELLQYIAADIEIKSKDLSDKIATADQTSAQTKVMSKVLENNNAIVMLLQSALKAQNDSLRALDTLGPNKGPAAPRV